MLLKRFPFLLVYILLVFSPVIQAEEKIAEASAAINKKASDNIEPSIKLSLNASSPELVLNDGWQFCPVQNFLQTVQLNVLECHAIQLPNAWESVMDDYNGYGLFYRHISASEVEQLNYQYEPLGIQLGRIRDADKVYFNEHLIGATGEFPPHFQKAVLYSRIYFLPSALIQESNTLKIWVYNDARPGGIVDEAPTIANFSKLTNDYHQKNYRALIFIVIIAVFALLHLVYFTYFRHAKENIFYAAFLIAWSIYLFTFSDLAFETGISPNLLFRTNVALFFVVFLTLPIFVFKFFEQQLPKTLTVILSLVGILVPVCFILPEPKLLYYPLQFVEVLALPCLMMLYWCLFSAVRQNQAYARSFSLVILLYTLFGGFDILVDLLQPQNLSKFQLYGPWALILLSIAMTFIISHKNFNYYQDATLDKLTQALRFDEFLTRLQQEFFRADRENRLMLLVMIDLDNFKQFNDQHGHLYGNIVLQNVAAEIRNYLRQFDLTCRYGGDEFCIAASFEYREEATRFTERLFDALNKISVEKNKVNESVSVTFGVAIKRANDNLSPLSLVEAADQNLIGGKMKEKRKIYW